ncbi:MAG: hypothetical protein ACRC35_11300, partial [Angustibacter sp.]
TGTNPFATGGGSRSGLSLAAGMGSVVALTVLLAPLVAAAFWSLDHPWLQLVLVPVSLGWGGLIWWATTRFAVGYLQARQVEVFRILAS